MDIHNENCLQTMKRLPDDSVDLILTDPPYGMTANKWDVTVDFMDEALRVSNLVVLTACQPYSSLLVAQNLKYFKYEWIWQKTNSTGFLNAKKQPLRKHEHILVFYKKQPKYYPQMTSGHRPVHSYTKRATDGSNYGKTLTGITGGGSTDRYPTSIITFKSDTRKSALHPTQKPVGLFEYLIETYTERGDIVYDPFMGSGTTAVVCRNTGRKFIGSEISKEYYSITKSRLKA